MTIPRSRVSAPVQASAFKGSGIRWYLRYGLSYRDVEEFLIERGIEVDHVSVFLWVQRFTPLLVDAARPCRHSGRKLPVRR